MKTRALGQSVGLVNAGNNITNKIPIPEVAKEFIRAEKSDNTRRSYASDVRILADWCRDRGYQPFRLAAGQLAEFLASQASSDVKAMTIVRRVAAVRHAYRVLELPDPFDQAARSTLAGIRNKLGTAVEPSAPLLAVDLLKIIDAIPYAGTNQARDFRDRALLLLGFAGALRRSELVALDVDDLQFCPEGLRLTIRRSKTDQAGQSAVIAVPYGSKSPRTCPVVAVTRWLRFAHIISGAVFLAVQGRQELGERLAGSAIGQILKRRVEGAGLPANTYSAHSLRSGFLTSSAEAGASIWSMMDTSRHRSVETLRSYVRSAKLFSDYAGKGLL